MLIILAISLFTSRIILQELGVDDYGIYIVVGGIVSLLGFLNSCASSTQRFLNFELGREGAFDKLKIIFSNALTIHTIIACIILVLAETIGLWFLNTQLVIPEASMYGANVIYQTSLVVFCLSVFQMPFSADIIAHERMEFYAFISIIDTILKLLAAYALLMVSNNRLIYYGFLLLSVQIIITLSYIVICIRNFKESSLRFSYSPHIFRELFSFTGWNMFGSIAWLARGQGIGIILNLFGGVGLNAAKGVCDQVSNAINTLSNNFQIALNPQITKSYASNHIEQMELLAYRGVKFSSILLWVMGLPLMLNISLVLDLWLNDVPKFSSTFICLAVIDILVSNLFGSPLMTSLSATGNIKKYQVIVSIIIISVLPISYIALKHGAEPQIVFIFNIVFSFMGGVARLIFCKIQIGFSIKEYH